MFYKTHNYLKFRYAHITKFVITIIFPSRKRKKKSFYHVLAGTVNDK